MYSYKISQSTVISELAQVLSFSLTCVVLWVAVARHSCKWMENYWTPTLNDRLGIMSILITHDMIIIMSPSLGGYQ